MKPKLLSLFLTIFSFATIYAQDFHGYVKKADSTSSPIFQAKVEITEGGKPFTSVKTYFDGSFKFIPQKNQTYSIKITYTGYTDTSYTFTTDKNAKPSEQNVVVELKKDGMRLMGTIISRKENFPIKEATIVLKNVMTRKEERITTDIDGRYNFKLEYETNYKVWLDKRSSGMFNLYKDTSFYISTIGFNQPLDYKLDIFLDAMLYPSTTVREGYDTSKQSANKKVKPKAGVIANEEKPEIAQRDMSLPVSGKVAKKDDQPPFKEQEKKLKSVREKTLKLHPDLENSQMKSEEVPNKEETQRKISDSISPITVGEKVKQKKGDEKLKAVNTQDTTSFSTDNVSNSEEKKQPLSELEITRQKAIAAKKTREIETQITIKNAEEEKKIADVIVQQKAKEKMLAAQQMVRDDSIAEVRQKNDSLMVVYSSKKAVVDSTAQTKTFYLSKAQEGLIAAAEIFARRKKFVQDSITMKKEVEMKMAGGLKKDK